MVGVFLFSQASFLTFFAFSLKYSLHKNTTNMKKTFLFFLFGICFSLQSQVKQFSVTLDNFPTAMVNHTTIDTENNEKWVSSFGHGLIHWRADDSLDVYTRKNSLLPNDTVFSTLIDSEQNLWVATFGGGLAKIDSENNWTIYDHSNSPLPSNFVTRIREDQEGNVWVSSVEFLSINMQGINGGGIAKINVDGVWTVYNKDNSLLPTNNIFSMEFDQDNNLWIGCIDAQNDSEVLAGGGLVKLNTTSNEWTLYDTNNSDIPANGIFTITPTESGELYIGTLFGKLAILDVNGNWNTFYDVGTTDPESGSFHCLNIVVKEDAIFLGAGPADILCGPSIGGFMESSGIYEFQKTTNDDITLMSTTPMNFWVSTIVNQILLDGDDFWISTYLQGLFAYNPQGVNHIPDINFDYEAPDGIEQISLVGKIYPNPVSNYLIFETSDPSLTNEAEAVLIWDITGKILFQQDIKSNASNIRINLPDGLPHTFFVGLKIGEELYVEKMVRE